MFSALYLSFILMLVVLFLNVVSLLISESAVLSREELSAYECGFEHHSLSRIPFSLRYFFLTLIFLLFDLEIVLILFLPGVYLSSNLVFSFVIVCLFVIFLFLTLLFEWNEGSLDWVL